MPQVSESHIRKIEALCSQLLSEVKKIKTEHTSQEFTVCDMPPPHPKSVEAKRRKNQYIYNKTKDIRSFLKNNPKIFVDIQYNGGTSSDWRLNCEQINLKKDLVTMSYEDKFRSFQMNKIKQIRVSSVHIQKALANYEKFHTMKPGFATIELIKKSSAGLSGWVFYEPEIPEQSTDTQKVQSP